MLQTLTPLHRTDLEQLLSVTALPERRPGHVVVQVRGEIDTYTEPLLRACLRSQITRPTTAELVVDLRNVIFLGAAGIAALVSARTSCRTRGIRFAVRAGDQPRVRRPLALAGLADLVRAEPADAGHRPGPGGRQPRARRGRRQPHPPRRPGPTHR